MKKKSKGELILEKIDNYILENFNKISNFELKNGIINIKKEYRNFKNIDPSLIFIFTIFRYKDLEFFKKFKTVKEMEQYFQKIITNFCIEAQMPVIQVPNEILEELEKIYYKLNPDVEYFDNQLRFYHKNKNINDEDVQELIVLKEKKIKELLSVEMINKSIFFKKIIKNIEFGEG